MEKRTIIAVIMSLLVFVIWHFVYIQPRMEEQKKLMEQQRKEAAIEAEKMAAEAEKEAEIKKAEETKKEQEFKDNFVFPEATTINTEEIITIENEYYIINFTNRGARVLSWKLKNYKDAGEGNLDIINSKMVNLGYLPFAVYNTDNTQLAETLNSALFETNAFESKIVLTNAGNKEQTLSFSYSDGKNNALTKTFTFHADSYEVGIQIEGAGDLLKQSYITLGPGLMTPKKDEETGSMFGIGDRSIKVVMGKLDGSADRSSKPSEQIKIKWDDLSYIGIETLYFTALYSHSTKAEDINDPNRVVLIDHIKNKVFDKTLEEQSMVVGLPITEKSIDKLFVGPKEYILTKKLGYNELVDFGFWSFLAVPMLMFLKWIYGFVQNYGIAILLMTLVINLIFFPLRQKSYKSMAKMRDLQPKINAIKNKYEKYKKDMEKRQQMNQEIMTLYRSEGASPTGGCLPLLIQFPFLIAIYQMLANAIELRQAPFFLWLNDLSVKDPYYITPIIMGLTMWYQNKLNPPASGGDQTMTKMMKFMPIIFTFMFLGFPSGLVIYWLFNNVLAIGQQYLIKRNQEQAKALAKGKRRK